MMPRLLALMTAAALLAGCASYEPAPIDPGQRAAALDRRSLDDPRLRRLAATLRPAAAAGTPGDLTDLTLAAVYFHPDLAVARARVEGAQAATVTAAQRPNPRLGLDPTRHSDIVSGAAWTVGLLVDFVLETAGRREQRVAQAQAQLEAARRDLATAAWQLRGRVRNGLLAVWAAEGRAGLLDRRLALQGDLVALLERRFQAGETAALDVARERIVLSQLNLARQDAARQAVEARAELAAAIGVPATALDGRPLAPAAFERAAAAIDDLPALRGAALRSRSDVQSQLATYEAAQAALRLQIAGQFPNLTIGPGYIYDQGDHQYRLGLGAELPVFNQNQGPIAEAVARRREAAARFDALQARVLGEIDRAAGLYGQASQALATADALKLGSERRRAQIARSFGAGELDRSAVVTADLEDAAVALSRFEVLVQQQQALGLLEDALQRPLLEPEAGAFLLRAGELPEDA